MPNYGPGSPGYVRSTTDTNNPALGGDIVIYAGTETATITAVGGNTTQSSFIAANVPCAASVQTVITSISLNPGKWDIAGTVSASVNAVYKSGDMEIALIPSGGAASVAYAGGALAADNAGTEAVGTVETVVTLPVVTTVQLVGFNVGSGSTSARFTALATTTGGYANATGMVATPVV